MADHAESTTPGEIYLDAPSGGALPPYFVAPQGSRGRPSDSKAVAAGREVAAGARAKPRPEEHAVGREYGAERAEFEKLRDVELDLSIELGRAEMPLADVMALEPGVVVPLDKRAGDPVDIVVNGRLVARGEVVVVENKFCVRVVELVGARQAKGP
jgi:flagellar motor switch protein FliN/FliY